MGTWAEGNFDNDGAMDFLDDLLGQMVATVEDVLGDKSRVQLDEEGEAELMPRVELIALLCERYNATPPQPTVIARWRKKYLKVFDEQINDLSPKDDFKKQRRKTIERTFHWLESLADSFWAK
jgi:hypothetical protein